MVKLAIAARAKTAAKAAEARSPARRGSVLAPPALSPAMSSMSLAISRLMLTRKESKKGTWLAKRPAAPAAAPPKRKVEPVRKATEMLPASGVALRLLA